MYKQNLALNILQSWICHKTQPTNQSCFVEGKAKIHGDFEIQTGLSIQKKIICLIDDITISTENCKTEEE